MTHSREPITPSVEEILRIASLEYLSTRRPIGSPKTTMLKTNSPDEKLAAVGELVTLRTTRNKAKVVI